MKKLKAYSHKPGNGDDVGSNKENDVTGTDVTSNSDNNNSNKKAKTAKEKKSKGAKRNRDEGGGDDDDDDGDDGEDVKPIDCRKTAQKASGDAAAISKEASAFLLGIRMGGSSTGPSPAITPTSLLTLALSNEEKGISPALHVPELERDRTPGANELAMNFLSNIAMRGSITPQPENSTTTAKRAGKEKKKKKKKKKKHKEKYKEKHKDEKKRILKIKEGMKVLTHKKKEKRKKKREDSPETAKMITYRGIPVCCVSHGLVIDRKSHKHAHSKIVGMLGKDEDLFERICGSNSIKSSSGFGSVSFCRLLGKSEKSAAKVVPIADNPGLQSLDKVTVLSYPSFVSSVRLHVKRSKRDMRSGLTKKFYALYPNVQGTEITFSSFLRVRRRMIHLSKRFLDVSTVAHGLCYIDCVLRGTTGNLGMLNKRNFKTFAAACLYLAVKFNQDEATKSMLKTTREKIQKYMKVTPENLVKYEFT